jgi:hypothetical protein
VKRTTLVRVVPPPLELVDWDEIEGKAETKGKSNGQKELF